MSVCVAVVFMFMFFYCYMMLHCKNTLQSPISLFIYTGSYFQFEAISNSVSTIILVHVFLVYMDIYFFIRF